MSGRKNPMMICGAVQFALGVAACGGGGGTGSSGPSPSDIAGLFAAAQDARGLKPRLPSRRRNGPWRTRWSTPRCSMR